MFVSFIKRRRLLFSSMNEFELYTEYANGQSSLNSIVRRSAQSRGYPIRVVIRAIENGAQYQRYSDLHRREMLASVLKEEVIRQVLAYRQTQTYPWNRARATRVMGYLQGINLDNAASHITTNALRISDLTTSFMDEIMDAIHESNMDIDLLDIEWSFIIDPNSILAGGASLVKPPPWVPKRYVDTWKPHVHDDGTVLNCAAFALTYMKLNRPDKQIRRLYQETKELMVRMQWYEVIAIEDLERYVQLEARDKRLTVLLPRLNHQVATTFTGPEFVFQEECVDNLIYLVYDITQEHFAACQSPQQLFVNHRNSKTMRWCHTCLFAYNAASRTCLCDNEEEQEKVDERKRRKKLKQQCQLCGLYGGQCDDCASSSCRFCGLFYAKNHMENDPHRCLVYQPNIRKDHESFWVPGDEEGATAKQTKFKLWAYDLESGGCD